MCKSGLLEALSFKMSARDRICIFLLLNLKEIQAMTL